MKVVVAIPFFALSGLCGYLFLTRYWLHRDCIRAAQSSCVLPDGTNLISGGAFWLVPCLLFVGVGLFLALRPSGDGHGEAERPFHSPHGR